MRKLVALVVLPLALSTTPSFAAEGQANGAYANISVAPVTATFRRHAVGVGDRVDQNVQLTLHLDSTTRNGQEVVAEYTTDLARVEERSVVVTEVAEGKAVGALVRFHRADHKLNKGEEQSSPVAGRTYRCRRQGEGLEVRRDDGTIPTPEEHEQVSASMESLGQTNPLADFFAGKTIAVGEKVTLPKEVGAGILGGDRTLGTVTRFEMTLREVAEREGRRVAVFDTEVEAEAAEGVQMRLLVGGQIDLDVDTCRTERLDLNGPLVRMSSFGSYSQRETTSVRGKMGIAMRAAYRDK